MTAAPVPQGSSATEPTAPAQLHEALLAAGQTVATAESLTGGLLAAALTDTPGASATFRGGLVVYATDLKASLAGVEVNLLAERGAVDPDVAIALATGARDRLGADWGIGVTGVAGPDPQDGQPVGTVYVGIAGPGGAGPARVHQLSLAGNRNMIRSRTVEQAVALILAVISRPDV